MLRCALHVVSYIVVPTLKYLTSPGNRNCYCIPFLIRVLRGSKCLLCSSNRQITLTCIFIFRECPNALFHLNAPKYVMKYFLQHILLTPSDYQRPVSVRQNCQYAGVKVDAFFFFFAPQSHTTRTANFGNHAHTYVCVRVKILRM